MYALPFTSITNCMNLFMSWFNATNYLRCLLKAVKLRCKNQLMKFKFKIIVCLVSLCAYGSVYAQRVEVLTTGTKTSIRGLSVVNDRVIWVSGSNGMVGRSVDSGKTFTWITVKGFEKSDFRDIEAFNETVAVIM